ncbi:sodium-dependent bicarbonate transport family permease [Candidatus Nitrosotenuis chungbukensis]|uniref:sodium-dependent bicarbonate transport family permease n=1 Tax=Candidatus Nitrosotenuis chungbukensis TaxID=1353246 RepID=UPI003B96964B
MVLLCSDCCLPVPRLLQAPAVLRTAIPQAKPSLYITSALGITFPYNIIVMLPIMLTLSSYLHNL